MRLLYAVVRDHGYLIPIAAVVVMAAVLPMILSHKEPLASRRLDVLRYVESRDHIRAIILGHDTTSGGTAWSVQPAGQPYESFEVVDNGFFRTHVSYDGYHDLLTHP